MYPLKTEYKKLNIERKVKDILINKLREKTLVTVKNEVEINEYPFCNDLPLVYLGEIANMPEHGIFIGKSGKCYFGYHIWNFRELNKMRYSQTIFRVKNEYSLQ